MSGQTDIFSYSQGKRDIGHSKFDMSFTNIRTQNFGQLLPVAVYETLPDDFWNIGSDGVTLLKPLAAPAFTSIKQHFYAFYTRNQQIWKHWNNYITNGTEMNQVYGSNVSNQNADSPWKVPYIPALYLQHICKIAHGYALHVQQKSFNVNTGCGGLFAFVYSSLKNANSANRYDVTDLVLMALTFQVNYNSSILSHDKEFYQFILDCAQKYFIEFNIKNTTLEINWDMPIPESNSLLSYIKGYDTASGSWSSTFGTDYDSEITMSGSSSTSSVETKICYLYDNFASECDLANSPFLVNQISCFDALANTSFKDFARVKRVKGRSVNTLTQQYTESGVGTASVIIYDAVVREVVESNFFGCRYCFEGRFYHDKDAEDHVAGVFVMPGYIYTHGFNLATDFYWEYQVSSDDEAASFTGPWTWTESLKASDDLLNLVPTYFGGNSVNGFNQYLEVMLTDGLGVYPYLKPSSFDFNQTSFHSDSHFSENGYSLYGWMWYLCRNSAQLIDSLHIPDVALATRSFAFYAFERFNALPAMAYSKNWEDHFRNRAVSSPELDFSGVNGCICSDSAFLTMLDDCKRLFAKLPSYAEDVDFGSQMRNSWSLHFDAMPRNGLADDSYVNAVDELAQFFDGTRHYFNVLNSQDVFSLLTGFGLTDMILNRLFDVTYNKVGDSSGGYPHTFETFSELFTKNFYLPNYYNGLLHCKFQNFNKDYFTAGMLDPMSGANDLSLGDTISELRVSEIKQSWFERIAQNRTVRKFMQRIFGITPIEEPKESRLLGVDHVPVKIGEVIQTSQTTETSVQGQRTGLGGGRGGHGLVHDRCNEHGWLIILSSFTVESQYMQGLDRTFEVKDSYMDYPTVDFAHIGNESILMKELNFDGPSLGGYPHYPSLDLNRYHLSQDGASPVNTQSVAFNPLRVVDVNTYSGESTQLVSVDLVNNVVSQSGTGLYNVFSYIPRYSSYKFKLDEVHGEFRSELQFWHTFRKFHTMPMLSHSFVNWELLADDNDFNRLFAVSKDDVDAKFCCMTFFNASVSRALPYVCVPKSTI